ncbi:hypothetical protein ACNKHP_09865 [Shigella boydii]
MKSTPSPSNRQSARARTYKFQTPLIPNLHDAAPFVNETGSDSSSMDNMLELLWQAVDIIPRHASVGHHLARTRISTRNCVPSLT